MILDLIESTIQNITPTALARRLSCSRQNITQVLRELRGRGWLTFTPEYSDGRSSIMRVSDTGRAVEDKQRLATVLRKLERARW